MYSSYINGQLWNNEYDGRFPVHLVVDHADSPLCAGPIAFVPERHRKDLAALPHSWKVLSVGARAEGMLADRRRRRQIELGVECDPLAGRPW